MCTKPDEDKCKESTEEAAYTPERFQIGKDRLSHGN